MFLKPRLDAKQKPVVLLKAPTVRGRLLAHWPAVMHSVSSSSLSGSFAAPAVSLAHRTQSLLSAMSWRIIICTEHGRWSAPQPAHQYLHRKRGRGNKSTKLRVNEVLEGGREGEVLITYLKVNYILAARIAYLSQ